MLQILSDDRIRFVFELFGNFGELITKPGAEIRRSSLLNVNALLTRSVTAVNANLLKGTAVKFVASATAGFDHIDISWLEKQSINWAYAPGANATAVAEYVLHCVAYLQDKKLLAPNAVAAVVGVGQVGSVVSHRLRKIGFTVLPNDPPRTMKEKNFISIPLVSLTEVDLICLHTPLIHSGKFPTYHLIDNTFLRRLKPGSILLNASRGAVVDNEALLRHNGIVTCLDVWEHEPNINLTLLKKTTLATPHIAGYSNQAQFRATLMIYEAFLKYFGLSDARRLGKLQQSQERTTVNIHGCHDAKAVLLKIFDPGCESQKMHDTLIKNPDHFEKLRCLYPLRNEFSAIQLTPTPSLLLQKELVSWGFEEQPLSSTKL